MGLLESEGRSGALAGAGANILNLARQMRQDRLGEEKFAFEKMQFEQTKQINDINIQKARNELKAQSEQEAFLNQNTDVRLDPHFQAMSKPGQEKVLKDLAGEGLIDENFMGTRKNLVMWRNQIAQNPESWKTYMLPEVQSKWANYQSIKAEVDTLREKAGPGADLSKDKKYQEASAKLQQAEKDYNTSAAAYKNHYDLLKENEATQRNAEDETKAKRTLWTSIYNSVMTSKGDEEVAIEQADAALEKWFPSEPKPPYKGEHLGGPRTDRPTSANAPVFGKLPSAAKYKNKIATDTETGKKYRSDGKKWTEVR